jgi:hypothetical protein
MDTSLASGARYVAAAGGGKRRWVTLPAPDSRQPIAEILGNVAAEAPYGSGDRLRVLRDEVAPFLGVKCCESGVEPTRSQKRTVSWTW